MLMKVLLHWSSALRVACMIVCTIIYYDYWKPYVTQEETEARQKPQTSLAQWPPICATSLPLAFSLLWERSHCETQIGLKLLIFLSQPPKSDTMCLCHHAWFPLASRNKPSPSHSLRACSISQCHLISMRRIFFLSLNSTWYLEG